MYPTFEYYSETYHGTKLTIDNFDYYEKQAESYIKYLTLNKSDKFEGEELLNCCCAIADKNFDFDNDSAYQHNNISSEKVGEYSVSYANSDITKIKNKEQLEIARQYLSMTGLLFRGVKNVL